MKELDFKHSFTFSVTLILYLLMLQGYEMEYYIQYCL